MLIRMMAVSLVLFSFAGAAAEEVKVTVTRKDCARLVRHQPSADVAYKPGVDAKGRPVAPADLPGSGATMKVIPDVLEIPITAYAGTWTAPVGGERVQSTIGTVTYDIAKGTFLFNGQPLGSAEMRDLAEACAKMGVR